MKKLLVSIEKEGELIPAGMIEGNGPSDSCFRYSERYLAEGSIPISISLPLQKEAFSPEQTSCFFEGLLPEGFTRRSVAQWLHLDEGDYLSILHGLGRECLGALCITERGEGAEEFYEKITDQQIRNLAAEGATMSAEMVTKSHLSLTGASGKVGLYYDASSGEWYLPHGTAPSTHIVKQSHVRLEDIVINEMLCQMTAAYCGIDIPQSFIVNTGSGKEQEILFATQRYDRTFGAKNAVVCGVKRPNRLHQEDFAQAMGIHASDKYERKPDEYLKRMFEILRQYSANPVADQIKLWDTVVFDYLIGNTDAHIKNFSLLYDEQLRQIRLAPAYDMISTVIYEQSTRNMAFGIGGVFSLDDITRDSFREAAKEVSLGERLALRRFDAMAERFGEALRKAAEVLAHDGYLQAEGIELKILQRAGIRNIV